MTHQIESNPPTSFFGLGIAPRLLESLARLKFTVPTPIQTQSIPVAIEGKDIIGVAQTGTGKTLAFGIPMIQRLAQVKGQGLILVPTRELAIQVDESLQELGRAHGLRTAVIIGGAAMSNQVNQLRRGAHVIIATPGRMNDHLEQGTAKLDQVKILVLDEADRMLDMGFAPQIMKIIQHIPKDRQTMLFSATMPNTIVGLAKSHMKLPVRVEVAPPGTMVADVSHEVFFATKEQKSSLLKKVLAQHRGSVLVFTRTKYAARKLARQLTLNGTAAADIHSDRTLAQRRAALEGFKSGKYRVLVATDIAARGIHVSGIELVINYDLPGQPEDYVHRVGRTARAGQSGRAISFATTDQWNDVHAIEKLIRKSIPVSQMPDLPPGQFPVNQQVAKQKHHHRSQRWPGDYPPRRKQFTRRRHR